MSKKPKCTHEFSRRDCVQALKTFKKVDLIIADPPYDFSQKYDSCDDKLGYEAYMMWTKGWLTAASTALSPTGSMWVFCPDEWVSEIDMFARRWLGMFKKRHVVWAFTFGQKAQRNFTRSHCHLLWFTKHNKNYTFNLEDVAVPSARQLVYKDKRAVKAGKPPDATWMLLGSQLEPFMGKDRDTWLESRICGSFKERKKHSPNQIPIPIMERIVLACTNPGDVVVDPFAGTGSSVVPCIKYGRNWRGFDLSQRCVTEGKARIAELKKG